MATVLVRGASLAAMAVAARLAKQRHEVTLAADPATLSADAIATCTRLAAVDLAAPEFTFPAPFRDLFRKSGRPLDAELARRGWSLVPAPARTVGAEQWPLPPERGAQFAALSQRFDVPTAERWRDLLDGLDDVWLARRRLGAEVEWDRAAFRQIRPQLWLDRSLADLSQGLPAELAELVCHGAPDPARAPAVDAVWLALERTFGRWQVVIEHEPVPAGQLVVALQDRLAQRKVQIQPEPVRAEVVVDARIHAPRGRWYRRPGPRTGWRRAHTPGAGRAQYQCGEHTAAGTGVIGQLLSAALASYAVHLDRTGVDIHPSAKPAPTEAH